MGRSGLFLQQSGHPGLPQQKFKVAVWIFEDFLIKIIWRE